MKRIIVLLVVALMSSMMLNAKNVRGFVSDKDGNPVAGFSRSNCPTAWMP